MTTESSLLRVEHLAVRYGSSRALEDVSLNVAPGSSLAIVGANGAGKSSLARALCGLIKPASGNVTFEGDEIAGLPAYRIRRRGLAYLPEGRGVFPTLSVHDNVRMAARWLDGKKLRREAIERAFHFFPILSERRLQRASTLSGGEQQMLALACELATLPKLVIADELSLGLAPMVVDSVFGHLQRVRESGVAVILIEQFIDRALAFADEVMILRSGTVAWSGKTRDISQNEIVARYLGDE